MVETKSRTLVRTLLYRLIALVITAYWVGLGDAVTIHIVLALLQYITERAWLKIKWGLTKIE